GPELGAEVFPEDLSHGVLRQLGNEADDLGLLEARQTLAAEVRELLRRQRLARAQYDEGGHPLAPLDVRHADDGGFLDRGMRLQYGLHLRRRDVLSPPDHHVVLAARR